MVPRPEVATLVAHAGGWDEMVLVARPSPSSPPSRKSGAGGPDGPRRCRGSAAGRRRRTAGMTTGSGHRGDNLDLLEVDAPAVPM